MDIESIPVGAVVGTIESPSSGVTIGCDVSRLDGVVVDPLGLAIVEGVDNGGSVAGRCIVVGAVGSIKHLSRSISCGGGLRSGRRSTSIELAAAISALSTSAAKIDVAAEGISDTGGSRGEMDFKGNNKGARSGEEELVGRNGSSNNISGRATGRSGGRNSTSGHLVSVDLSALEVVEEAVIVAEGDVEGGQGSTIRESASETVVTSGGSEGGEGTGISSRPAGIAEGGLSPGIGGLRNIGVLPLGGRSSEEVDSEGSRAILQSSTGLVGKTALEDSDVSNGDQNVSGSSGTTPTITVGISEGNKVVSSFPADSLALIGVRLGCSTSNAQNEDSRGRGALVDLEGLFVSVRTVVLEDHGFIFIGCAGEA